jgi:hypothetical protein
MIRLVDFSSCLKCNTSLFLIHLSLACHHWKLGKRVNLYETGKWWLVQERAEDLDSGKWKQRTAIVNASCLQKKERFGKHSVAAAEELGRLP